MLSPGEFSVGYIGDATSDLTLLLPRGRYEVSFLITRASGSPYAIFLDGEHKFHGFECTNNNSWSGILVPNVSIEIDHEAMLDAQYDHSPLGSLVRRDTKLEMITLSDSGFRRSLNTPLIIDLPACRQNMATGFTKWRICIGEGITKRELKRIEIGST